MAADKADYIVDSRVSLDHADQLPEGIVHRREGRVLRPLHTACQGARVLLRKKAFRDPDDQHKVQCNGRQENEDRRTGMFQYPRERVPVDGKHLGEEPFTRPVEPAMIGKAFVLQQMRAHHRRGSQRNHHRDHDGGRESDRKLAEKAADDAAHHEYGDEDGDQRDADREHRKADLFGSLDGGGKRRQARFEMP